MNQPVAAAMPMSSYEPAFQMTVHIGYPRTASSFLQTQLFQKLDDFIPATHYDELPKTAAELRTQTDTGLRGEAVARTRVVYSNESLSGWIDGDNLNYAEVVRETWPNARILIVIRSQYTIFRSYYHLAVKGGSTETFHAFVESRLGKICRYRELVERYQKLFGADNVKVLLYEDLSRDPQSFLKDVLDFTGHEPAIADRVRPVRVKSSVGDATMKVLRWRNILMSALVGFSPRIVGGLQSAGLPGAGLIDQLADGFSFAKLPVDELRPLIRTAYAEGNAELFARLGKRIGDYSYPRP